MQHSCEGRLQGLTVNCDDVDYCHLLLCILHYADHCAAFHREDWWSGDCFDGYNVPVEVKGCSSSLGGEDVSFDFYGPWTGHEFFDDAQFLPWDHELSI